MNTQRSNELYHYGVPGMKWGVRRAVRNDASVRSARKRYNRDFNAAAKAATKTKSFAITQKGKAKKAARDKAYSESYDRMMASQKKLKAAETKARNKAEKELTKPKKSPIAQEMTRQKKHIAKKRAIDAVSRYLQRNGKSSARVDNAATFGKLWLDKRYTKKTFND